MKRRFSFVSRFVLFICTIFASCLIFIFLSDHGIFEFSVGDVAEKVEEQKSRLKISDPTTISISKKTDDKIIGQQIPAAKRVIIKAVHIGVVACGGRIEEPLMMLKSAVIFGHQPLHVHVIADDRLWPKFAESLPIWQRMITWRSFSFTLYLTSFPGPRSEEWRRLFKLCASQRLFIPDLLVSTDAVLYVDTDVIFLRPPEDLWAHFAYFNESHVAGMSPESEDAATNWYARFARHPYFKPFGVNSGVMLMNLTRMRSMRWSDYLPPILDKYRYNITWGDQDIINILFSSQPDKLYLFGCEWNYRPDHCMYNHVSSFCARAEEIGASILHGSRGYFHTATNIERKSMFKEVYDAFKRYKFGSDLERNLLNPLRTISNSNTESSSDSGVKNANCGASRFDIFFKQMEAYYDKQKKKKEKNGAH